VFFLFLYSNATNNWFFRQKLSDCGALFKFGFFIISPTTSWVAAMIFTNANLTGSGFSSVLTFGQESVF